MRGRHDHAAQGPHCGLLCLHAGRQGRSHTQDSHTPAAPSRHQQIRSDHPCSPPSLEVVSWNDHTLPPLDSDMHRFAGWGAKTEPGTQHRLLATTHPRRLGAPALAPARRVRMSPARITRIPCRATLLLVHGCGIVDGGAPPGSWISPPAATFLAARKLPGAGRDGVGRWERRQDRERERGGKGKQGALRRWLACAGVCLR